MLSPRNPVLVWVAPLFLVTLAGCGRDGPAVVRVTGTLKHKGEPVPNALLHFMPEKGRQSWAHTDARGKFKVNYDRHQDGAVVGKHKVWIEYRASEGEEIEPGMPAPAPKATPEHKALFRKYGSPDSAVEVEITRKSREIEIDLP